MCKITGRRELAETKALGSGQLVSCRGSTGLRLSKLMQRTVRGYVDSQGVTRAALYSLSYLFVCMCVCVCLVHAGEGSYYRAASLVPCDVLSRKIFSMEKTPVIKYIAFRAHLNEHLVILASLKLGEWP